MKLNRLVITIGFILSGCQSDHWVSPPLNRQIDSYVIFAGQSNMVRMNPAGERAFSRAFPNTEIVNCAVGGSYLRDWEPNGALFQACLDKVDIRSVVGICFYQGEGDASGNNYAIVDLYAQVLQDYFTLYRKRLGNEKLPIVFAQIAHSKFEDTSCWRTIQDQQAAVNQAHTSMIMTKDLPLSEDMLHLRSDAYADLGTRFAEALRLAIEKAKGGGQ